MLKSTDSHWAPSGEYTHIKFFPFYYQSINQSVFYLKSVHSKVILDNNNKNLCKLY